MNVTLMHDDATAPNYDVMMMAGLEAISMMSLRKMLRRIQ